MKGGNRMKVFDKQPKFIAAKCPSCGGRLELDADFEVAYCTDCGTQCIIKHAKKRKKGALDKIFNFVERQQSIYRQDIKERERKILEQKKINYGIKQERRNERKKCS